MKILHIINVLATGGAEKLLIEMLPEFEKRGVETHLLIFDGKDTIFFQMLRQSGYVNYQSLGVNINLYNPWIILKIIPFFKEYDIIHAHLFQPQYFVSLAKLFSKSKVKIITTEHNTINRRRNHFLLKHIDKLIYKNYDKIIAVADITYSTLIDHLNYNTSDLDKIVTISNGIKVDNFYNVDPANLSEILSLSTVDSLKFGVMVARFIPPKDQATVIRSIKSLDNNFHLILVGEGPMVDDCKKLANSLSVSDRVHFIGRRKDVANILKAVDIVVMSSFNEGLSLSSLEGLASGKPVVASDVVGLREIVDGAGLLFEYGNDSQLADQINKLLTNQVYYDQIVTACLSRAREYDISIMVDKYINLYLSL